MFYLKSIVKRTETKGPETQNGQMIITMTIPMANTQILF